MLTPAATLKQALIAQGINVAVPWVLMASYLYYHRDTSILTDEQYDALVQALRARWDRVEHRHKHLLAELIEGRSTTLYYLTEADYPTITRSAACQLAGIGYREPRTRKGR
ncbi:MAG: hypothetical protein QJR07_10480 [Acetobacteraceae bacterium]|nr:hypothetical protein [Acetobacteraceae bacterium]